MGDLNKRLVHLSVPLFMLHFIEEYYLGLPNIDRSISIFSSYIGLTNDITYLMGQLILFVFLAILLSLIILDKNIKYGAVIIEMGLIYEFTHILPVIISRAYYPGFFTGLILFILGLWYAYKIIFIKFIKGFPR